MKVPIPWTPLFSSQVSGETSRETALWRGDWREFWMQWHEDRVYFQLVDGAPSVWASLETCAPDEALACFEDAVCQRNYGVCFEQCTNVYAGCGLRSLRLQFVYAPNGTGLLREWCSRDWLPFNPQQTRVWALSPDLHLPEIGARESVNCCIYAAKSVREQILFRRVSEADLELLSWKSATDEEEFERAIGWLWNAGLIWQADYANRYVGVSVYNSIPHAKTHLHLSNLNCGLALESWLKNYFVGAGFEWHAMNWGQRRFRKLRARQPHLRAFFEPESVRWHVSFQSVSAPSFHQQIEARLHLRAWLRDRATPSEAERFLAPDG